MVEVLESINGFLWGIPALVLILGVGIYICIRSRFIQFRLFGQAFKRFLFGSADIKRKGNGVSQFQALCTALAATVGTGNIAGVAGAITIGGPGAIFWMWICGLIGMTTKFAEATLSVCYRYKNTNGEYVGGPMYMIENGMGKSWKWLAQIYCFFGIVAALGVGNATQINAVIGGVNAVIITMGGRETTQINMLIGILLAVLLGTILIGGGKRIGAIAQMLVPIASVGYILLCSIVIGVNIQNVPKVFSMIITGAFQPAAVTGGILGSAFRALRTGASRGTFTNEAGMGTAAIAHSAAEVAHPVEQGMMGIVEVFVDTIVICTMTAFVILCSGVPVPYGTDPGVGLTLQAFSLTLGSWTNILIACALAAFAVATIIGWGLYGGRCAQYLFGDKAWKCFVWLQVITSIIGAFAGTQTVWLLAEIVNALMAIPNLIALLWLCPKLIGEINAYNAYKKKRSS